MDNCGQNPVDRCNPPAWDRGRDPPPAASAAGAAAAVLDTYQPYIPKKFFKLFPKYGLALIHLIALNCNSYQHGVNDEHDIPDKSKDAVPTEPPSAKAVDQEHSAFGQPVVVGSAAAA